MARSRSPRRRESNESEDEGERLSKRVKVERTERVSETVEPEDEEMGYPTSDLDDDEKNEEAFNAARARRGRYMGTVSEAGVLKSINLVNFMCHKNLTVQFAPRLNFLVGHNGSGKSAVLTAVAVALGAKAAITGRGQGVKELIMHGADRAIITLTIANKGVDAFEPDRYTDDIIIERIIDRSGSSQYKFRTVRGGNILEKKSIELKNIMNHFNLDIDSPLTLLTQDAAKSFLATTDERKLYSFFLRGTNLQYLADSYSATQATVLKMEREVKAAKEAEPGLEARVRRLGGQIQVARKAGEIRLEHDKAKIELAWSYVNLKEKEVEKKSDEVAEDEEKLRLANEEIQKHKMKIQKLAEDISELEQEVNDEMAARAPLRKQKQDAKNALAKAQGEVEAVNEQINEAKASIHSKKDEIAHLNKEIAARAKDKDSALDPAMEQIREKIKKHDDMFQNMTRAMPTKEREQADAIVARDRAEEARRVKEDARQEASAALEQARRNLQPFMRSSRDPLERFGNNIGAVMDRIKRAEWRAGPPLGPLGRYVQLEDERYRPVLESYLGGLMCQFAVRCDQDRLTLLRILTECSQRNGYNVPGMQSKFPPVIQWKGDMFDYSRGDLSARAETILSKLKFSDEAALRIFINQARIEKTLVAPNSSAGKDLIDKLLAARAADSIQVISADMKNQVGRANFTQLNPMPNWKGAGIFVRDTEAERRVLEGKVQSAKAELDAAIRQVDEAVQAARKAESDLRNANGALQRLREGRFGIEKKLRELRDELERSQPVTGDALLSTRSEVEALISEEEKQLADLEGSLKRHLRDQQEAEQNYKRISEQLIDTSLQEKKQAIHQMMEQRQVHQQNVRAREDSLPRYRDRVTKSKAELEKLEGMALDWATKAENFGPRVETQKDPKDVQKYCDSLERQLKEAEKQNNNVNLDDLTANYNDALQKLNESRTKINGIQNLAAELKRNVIQRQAKWQELRHHVAVRARTAFIANIHKRGYDGRLVFNHDNETLSIRVQTSNVGKETQGGASQYTKAPLNLSGGERSYSTVSFLTALWDTSGNTIRCLDEWDVFLDMVNRRIASQVLIDSARESDNKQYIFITPQDMAGMTAKANEKVIRMTDPVRGQQTLPFAPQ